MRAKDFIAEITPNDIALAVKGSGLGQLYKKAMSNLDTAKELEQELGTDYTNLSLAQKQDRIETKEYTKTLAKTAMAGWMQLVQQMKQTLASTGKDDTVGRILYQQELKKFLDAAMGFGNTAFSGQERQQIATIMAKIEQNRDDQNAVLKGFQDLAGIGLAASTRYQFGQGDQNRRQEQLRRLQDPKQPVGIQRGTKLATDIGTFIWNGKEWTTEKGEALGKAASDALSAQVMK